MVSFTRFRKVLIDFLSELDEGDLDSNSDETYQEVEHWKKKKKKKDLKMLET